MRGACLRCSIHASTSAKSHTTQRGVRLKRCGNSPRRSLFHRLLLGQRDDLPQFVAADGTPEGGGCAAGTAAAPSGQRYPTREGLAVSRLLRQCALVGQALCEPHGLLVQGTCLPKAGG
jgi:hypothetical protein